MTNPATSAPPAKLFDGPWVRRAELCVALVLSAAWIVYHVRFFLHAGGLWRDEVNSVNLATSPTIADIWQNLQYDSFPMLWHLVLRIWIRSGIGSTDRGLRTLGMLTGLGILCQLWINARRFRFPTPLVALTLLGFTAAIPCYGDSIRGHGLGALLELMVLGLMWDVTVRPSSTRITAALVVSLASVHMQFYNSMILAAICSGAIAVALSHRRWKRAAIVATIGAICAASMVIYFPAIHRASNFRPSVYHPTDLGRLCSRFSIAIGYDQANFSVSYPHIDQMWQIAFAFGVLSAIAMLVIRRRSSVTCFDRDVVVYHLVVLCVGTLGYTWFLLRLSYLIQPWYFLPFLALAAACLDGLFAGYRNPGMRIVLCLASLRFCLFAAQPVWFDAGLRKTSVPDACAKFGLLTRPGDLIVISPFILGDSFERYYHGPANVTSVPPVGFLQYQNYDLLIDAMLNPRVMEPAIAEAIQTLREGHAVYVLGDFEAYSPDSEYPMAGIPSNTPLGWSEGGYYDLWKRQLAFATLRHVVSCAPVDVQRDGVSAYERPGAMVMKGWIDSEKTTTR